MIEVEDPDERFGIEPMNMKCHNCFREMTTRVEDSVTDSGWLFAFFCFLPWISYLSWINSLLLCCLPSLRQFSHYCPLCNVLLGTARPKHSAAHIIVLAVNPVMSLLTFALISFLNFFFFAIIIYRVYGNTEE